MARLYHIVAKILMLGVPVLFGGYIGSQFGNTTPAQVLENRTKYSRTEGMNRLDNFLAMEREVKETNGYFQSSMFDGTVGKTPYLFGRKPISNEDNYFKRLEGLSNSVNADVISKGVSNNTLDELIKTINQSTSNRGMKDEDKMYFLKLAEELRKAKMNPVVRDERVQELKEVCSEYGKFLDGAKEQGYVHQLSNQVAENATRAERLSNIFAGAFLGFCLGIVPATNRRLMKREGER